MAKAESVNLPFKTEKIFRRKKDITMGKFVISKAKNEEYTFVLKATNGQVIAVSEGYTAKAGCLNGIESVQKNAPDAEIVEE